ncbi:hypothetical protein HK405_000835, partial [Cladochytrium tenue]
MKVSITGIVFSLGPTSSSGREAVLLTAANAFPSNWSIWLHALIAHLFHEHQDTIVEINKQVRLTPDFQSRRGFAWTKTPLTAPSWVVEFDVRVSGSGRTLYGDGLAFWFTQDRMETGPVFGSKDKFVGLGIFLDTYNNGRHHPSFPYVLGMVGDGETSYDVGTDGMETSIGGCSYNFRRKDTVTTVRIKYLANTLVEVSIKGGKGLFEPCFSAADITLPSQGYLGFSAHTGD